MDTGTGYGRTPATYLRELTEVGPGTPMGERLRRYCINVSHDASAPPVVFEVGNFLREG
jgi:hypothetical protein